MLAALYMHAAFQFLVFGGWLWMLVALYTHACFLLIFCFRSLIALYSNAVGALRGGPRGLLFKFTTCCTANLFRHDV
jgi:hypothetical protein